MKTLKDPQIPPYYNKQKGGFGWKQFLEGVDEGFTFFNDHYDTFVVLGDDGTTQIFRSVSPYHGVYALVNTESFLKEYPKATGRTFRRRIQMVLYSTDLVFVEKDERSNKTIALSQMQWFNRISKLEV